MAVSGLKAAYRNGQVFLTWDEAATPAGTTFNAYIHTQPITAGNLAAATKIGHHIESHSATDWFQDPSFRTKPGQTPPAGFVIETGRPPLDPSGGLFVHTVAKADEGERYYAVTTSDAQGNEDATIAAGASSLAAPVEQKVAPIQPIWLNPLPAPARDLGKGRSLCLVLHGHASDMEYLFGKGPRPNFLVFGDAKQGWREGLPHKFTLYFIKGVLQIYPIDRTWVGRPLPNAVGIDYHGNAIPSFWYGYTANIYDPAGRVVPTNFTEEHLLWLLKWAREDLGLDGQAYIYGSSMGGCGAVSMAMRYPELFPAVMANVPVVAYVGPSAVFRLTNLCGPLDETVLDNEGVPFLERMNGTLQVSRSRVDLPYIYMTHGRQDASIPWANNPPFYRALDAARQAYSAFWNNATHPQVLPQCPADAKAWMSDPAVWARFSEGKSYPAFSNCSTNKNPGNGDAADGDIEGWMNRGMSWSDVVDEPGRYSIRIAAAYDGITYPVTVDVTPRRVRQFKLAPGTRLHVQIDGQGEREVVADDLGLVTVTGVAIPSAAPVQITIRR